MFKNLLILLFTMFFCLNIISCSSSDTEGEDVEVVEAEGADADAMDDEAEEVADDLSDEEGDEFADSDSDEEGDEFADSDEEGDEFADSGDEGADVADLDGDEEFSSDELEDADDFDDADMEEGDSKEIVASSDEGELDGPVAEERAAGATDEVVMEDSEAVADNGGDDFAESSATPESAPVEEISEAMSDEGFSDSDYASTEDFSSPNAGLVSVKKMKDAPFTKNDVLANSLYIVRAGDDLSSISQKIYGNDRTQDLLQVNTTLGNGVKVGDKVYYNSPKRPSDSSQMKTYYEDMGLQAETYTSQEGDNIRTVAKNLLGHERSWMEIYAMNPVVDSKAEIPGGLQLRYWSGSQVPMTTASAEPVSDINEAAPPEMNDIPDMANNESAPAEAQVGSPEDLDSSMPPPPAEVAQNDFPPPPPVGGQIEDDFPPPPPAAGGIEPPPAPPAMDGQMNADNSGGEQKSLASVNSDQTLYMGAGLFLLVGAIILFIIRKKKRASHAVDFSAMTETKIE